MAEDPKKPKQAETDSDWMIDRIRMELGLDGGEMDEPPPPPAPPVPVKALDALAPASSQGEANEELEVERFEPARARMDKASLPASKPSPRLGKGQLGKGQVVEEKGVPGTRVRVEGGIAPARPADAAIEEVRREDLDTGYAEFGRDMEMIHAPAWTDRPRDEPESEPEPKNEPAPLISAASVAPEQQFEFGVGIQTFDEEALKAEPEPAPPPAEPEKPPELAMQSQMEVTDFFAGFDASGGFSTTREAPYTGLALQIRELFTPVEELLHELGGEGISVRQGSEDEICAHFASQLVQIAAQYKVVPLMVKVDRLLCEGRPVLREAKLSGSGLYRLYAAGVQAMTVVEGIDRSQGEALARMLTRPAREDAKEAEQEGDVARWFWETGLSHVRLQILETFDEVEALPETGLPSFDVPDQAVEQMVRLKSRLLSSVPGVSLSRGRASAVRNITISSDDLRALGSDLFRMGAELLAPGSAVSRRVVPFPGLPALDAEVRQSLEQDRQGLDNRQLEALLQTIMLLQEPERSAALVEAIVARPQALFTAGEVDQGVLFFKNLSAWAAVEPGSREKTEAVEAVLLRACAPAVLMPLLERYHALAPEAATRVNELLDLLPAPAVATLGIAVARAKPNAALAGRFKTGLERELAGLIGDLDALAPEQVAGLLDGAVKIGSGEVSRLSERVSSHRETAARQAAARACVALPESAARAMLEKLLADEEPGVRQEAMRAIRAHRQAALLAPAILKETSTVRYHEWLFLEKREAMCIVAQAMGGASQQALRQIAQRSNPFKRRSTSETRAAALLAMTLLKDPAHERVAAVIARESERPVVVEAAKFLLKAIRLPNDTRQEVLSRMERQFAAFDKPDDAPEDQKEDESVAHELSPRAIKAMRIDDLELLPGERIQVLGGALAKELSNAMALVKEKELSGEVFLVVVGRIANIAGALSRALAGPVALQIFADHAFVNGQCLRLPFAVYQSLGPLREVFGGLRIQEVMLAEVPTRSDIVELLYAIVTALKVEREPWVALERNFARVRLRELSLIKESWGRPADVAVDVRANAARLFGALYLWLDDVSRLPDQHDLLPVRAERLVRELTDAHEEADALREGLVAPKVNPGDAALFIAHCASLTASYARWLGCRRDQIASLISCALHRQVGLLVFARPLLEDLGAESENEALELLRLPLYSSARVAAAMNCGQSLGLPLVTAFEARAPVTTVAAPARTRRAKARVLMHSRILAVVERYVFWTSSFPRRPALAPDEALARMLADPEQDARLVQALANFAQVIPSGARVRLSDGREAVVLSAPLQMSMVDPLILRITVESDGAPAGDLLRGSPVVALTGDEESVPEISGVLDPRPSSEVPELAALLM